MYIAAMKSRDDKPPRAWNSTIAQRSKPMNRGPAPKRSARLASEIAPSRKPIPKSNPERQKKAAKRAAAKHRAYMASETRKAVDARADGRCEFACNTSAIPSYVTARYSCFDGWSRCASSEGLQHHHKTYSRYGGNELPTDILVVCKAHHDYLESLKPAGNRFTRRGLTTP